MKQFITYEQLKQLSKKGIKNLREWWVPSEGETYVSGLQPLSLGFTITKADVGFDRFKEVHSEALPYLSIGKMIDIIEDKWYKKSEINGVCDYIEINMDTGPSPEKNTLWFVGTKKKYFSAEVELCDALWEATKKILEK